MANSLFKVLTSKQTAPKEDPSIVVYQRGSFRLLHHRQSLGHRKWLPSDFPNLDIVAKHVVCSH